MTPEEIVKKLLGRHRALTAVAQNAATDALNAILVNEAALMLSAAELIAYGDEDYELVKLVRCEKEGAGEEAPSASGGDHAAS